MNGNNWLKYAIFSLGLILLGSGLFLIFIPYTSFIDFLINLLHLKSHQTQFETKILPESKFFFFTLSLIFFGIIFIITSSYFSKILINIYNIIKLYISQIFNILKSNIALLSKTEKYVLITSILLFGISKFYILFHYELLVDEAFSYVFLVSKGLLVTMTYYPGPNNHILYNLICCIFDVLPFSTYWVLKLPALFISIFTLVILFIYVKKRFDVLAAVLAISALTGQELFITYSLLGRGYSLLTLCTLGSLIGFLEWFRNYKKVYLFLFVISSILGFYTIPIFLYPFSAFFLVGYYKILKTKNLRELKIWTIAILTISAIVGILYSPIIFFNGIDAITDNSWVTSFNYQIFLSKYLVYLSQYLITTFSVPNLWYLVIIFPIAGYLTFKKALPSLFIWLYLLPIIIFTFQRVLPFDRVWTYFSVINAFALVYFFQIFKNQILKISLLGIVLIWTIWSTISVQNSMIQSKHNTEFFTSKIISVNKSTIFTNDDTYNIFLRIAYLENKKPLQLEVNQYYSKNYEVLVLSNSMPIPTSIPLSKYHLLFKNEFVSTFVLD